VSEQLVHWIHRATRIDHAPEPFDTAHVSIYYPAGDGERVDPVGTRPVETSFGLLPIAVILPGMNTELTYYRWLALSLARRGYAVMLSSLISEIPPNNFGITPGVDLNAIQPDTYGTKPVGKAIAGVLRLAADLNAGGVLAGALDLDNVALIGHSAGGTVALESAHAKFFPQIKAVITYASHTMASTVFGWPLGSCLPLSGDAAVMMFSGTQDGLIAAGMRWYADSGDVFDPMERTFETLPATAASADSYLIQLQGANHFSVLQPQDGLWPRADEDFEAGITPEQAEEFIGAAAGLFLNRHLRNDLSAGEDLKSLVESTSFVKARST
jgi:predicted dienelactone hydrolase